MRTFIALEIPDAAKKEVRALQQRLRTSGAKASWVKPDNMHLTLRFLGDVDADQVDRLKAELATVCTVHPSLTLRAQGLGVFPNLRRPAVVCAGVTVLAGDLVGLQQGIEETVQRIGLPAERKVFHPHITLARIRDHRKMGLLIDQLQKEGLGNTSEGIPVFGDDFTVSHVSLWKSELRPTGPIYMCLREFSLL